MSEPDENLIVREKSRSDRVVKLLEVENIVFRENIIAEYSA